VTATSLPGLGVEPDPEQLARVMVEHVRLEA
jgi:hypothetical protein